MNVRTNMKQAHINECLLVRERGFMGEKIPEIKAENVLFMRRGKLEKNLKCNVITHNGRKYVLSPTSGVSEIFNILENSPNFISLHDMMKIAYWQGRMDKSMELVSSYNWSNDQIIYDMFKMHKLYIYVQFHSSALQ